MKIIKYILLAIVLLGSEQITLSQYYLKVKSDSISLKSDSVFLFINDYRGVISWQASSDHIHWVSLNNHNDTLGVRIDSSAYYRATIVEENCNPVMSDTAFLIEKLTITNSNQFTVDSMGGVFLLPSGIKVKIPEGAVTEPKEIKLDILGFDDANALSAINISENTAFLSGLSFATDAFDFKKSIKIKIPVQGLKGTGMPMLYELDNENGSWLLSNEMMIVSIKGKFVEIIMKGSDQNAIAKGTKSESTTQGTKSAMDLNSIRNLIIKFYDAIFLNEDPCRLNCYLETEDYDKTGSDECSVVQAKLQTVFWDCSPVQTERSSVTEISPSCVPQLNISPKSLKIKKGTSGSIMLTTSIGDLPLQNQEIQLSASGNLLVTNPVIFTGSDGNVSFNVQGIEVGPGTISLSVSFDYYLTTIFAEANGQIEKNTFDHKTIKRDYTINVLVYYLPEVATGSVTDIKCTSATAHGNVIKDNYSDVTERGVLFMGSKISAGSGLGAFSASLTDLNCNSPYSVTAYAVNEAGTGYGDRVSFTTLNAEECVTVESNITYRECTKFVVKTNIISHDNLTVTECGVYHGLNPNPRLTGTKVAGGGGTGTFNATFAGIPPEFTYYMQAYATTDCGTVYGNEISYCGQQQAFDTVSDIDGNIYKTVAIYNQIWMAENLKTTRFNDGQPIPLVTTPEEWEELSHPGYEILWSGAIYSWYAVSTGKLCPVGWHVSIFAEWASLIDSCGGKDIAGSKLKETGTTHWSSPNTDATNETCFTALPNVYTYPWGGYGGQNSADARLWVATKGENGNYAVEMGSWNSDVLLIDVWDSNCGHAVRCVKDNIAPGTKGDEGVDSFKDYNITITIKIDQ